ncbi:nucleotide kinase (related to CMP and AMP kinase)-like protein [Methanocorpusculum labreanum Z]|uniref:Putative adenylate kinase n=1 Tax=Methanocorpusculum labreanum (strain ATCC 43576 / DSM 4855 / Z) TaxID=410358 RepID=A2SSJ0_METLZ|nr:adenylate kinase family protein [Methanocorpusculum labreanum]ABN07296.1 nucleotide kinase (related to CMP and AMP kinase)-like protein [Methanocorpusculum labreanum Z]
MMIGITGTPGCGKTTVADLLRDMGYPVLDLKTTVGPFVLEHDDASGSDIVDVDAWADAFPYTEGFVEGGFAHYLPCDKIVILRCRPDVLRERLASRGYSKEKIRENLEAEALDVILIETADAFASEQIYEIDTTSTERESVVRRIISFAKGETPASFGSLDWSEYIADVI